MNIWQLVQAYKAMFRPPVEDLLGADFYAEIDEIDRLEELWEEVVNIVIPLVLTGYAMAVVYALTLPWNRRKP